MSEHGQSFYVLKPRLTPVGQGALAVAMILFVIAGISYVRAEIDWQSAISPVSGLPHSVGVGTSTFHAIAFLRSIVFAALGCFCAIIGFGFQESRMVEETAVQPALEVESGACPTRPLAEAP